MKRAGAHLRKLVADTLIAHAPPSAPPCFQAVLEARAGGRGKVFATVLLFDGLEGEVKLEKWSMGWSSQWLSLPGGAFMLGDDNQWVRDPHFNLEAEAA